MKDTRTKSNGSAAGRLLTVLAAGLISVAAAAPAIADEPKSLADTMRERKEAGRYAADDLYEAQDASASSDPLAETWGVEVTSIRLTAADHMIDYRYRVLDAGKAADLFKRQIKPFLIHQETGRVLAVPETAKLGPLRNSNTPQNDRIYWMFFGNASDLVKAGDLVTVVIGDYRVEDLVVE